MRNPLRWFFPRRSKYRPSDPSSRASAREESLPTASGADLERVESRLLEAFQSGLETVTRAAATDQSRLADELGDAMGDLRRALATSVASIESRLTRLDGALARLREDCETRLAAIEERSGESERRSGEILGRTDLLQKGIENLTSTFEEELSDTEKALRSLQESGDRQLSELRETHRRHIRSLEEARLETESLAARSRERLGRRMMEMATFLESEGSPPAFARSSLARETNENPGWRRPWKKLRSSIRRSLMQRREIARLEESLSELEGFLLRERDQRLQRSRALRQVWLEERELFPRPEDGGRHSLDEERFAREISARRAGLGSAGPDGNGSEETASAGRELATAGAGK